MPLIQADLSPASINWLDPPLEESLIRGQTVKYADRIWPSALDGTRR